MCCCLRGLLGEETCASTFHKGFLLFFLSLKTEKTWQGCQCITTAPAPVRVRAVQDRACPAPRSWRTAMGSGQPALCHPRIRADTRKDHVRPFFFLHHFMDSLWHIPFWASCLHPPPKTQGSSNGKGQPPLFLSRGHPAQTPRPASFPAAPDAPTARSRATREELPGIPGSPGTTRLIPQPWNYKSQKILRRGPATS